MKAHHCTCAYCMGIHPYTARFAQCIQRGWIIAAQAVTGGFATAVVPEYTYRVPVE